MTSRMVKRSNVFFWLHYKRTTIRVKINSGSKYWWRVTSFKGYPEWKRANDLCRKIVWEWERNNLVKKISMKQKSIFVHIKSLTFFNFDRSETFFSLFCETNFLVKPKLSSILFSPLSVKKSNPITDILS